MAQYPTKVLSNVGLNSSVTAGNPGVSYKYHKFTYNYNVAGTDSAAVTGQPLGTAPCACTYVGMTAYITTGTPSTSVVTYGALKMPFDAASAAGVALNTTNLSFGTTVVAYPASCFSANIEQAGQTTIRGSNSTTTTTGIVAPVFATGSTIQFRQGDVVGITSTGTFTGVRGVNVDIWLREDNGNV